MEMAQTRNPSAAADVAAPPMPGDGQQRPLTRTARVATVAFVVMAALDTFEPTILVTGAWWLVLLLVWLMPWPVIDARRERQALFTQVAALTVFAWLYLRANVAFLEAVDSWQLTGAGTPVRRLIFVLQDLLMGLVSAALLVRPILRVFRRESVAAAFVVATPWIILTGMDTVFEFDRWLDKPVQNIIFLFEAAFPTLLLMVACEWGTRTLPPVQTASRSAPTSLSTFLRGGAGIWRSALAVALVLTLKVELFRADIALPDALLDSIPVLGSAFEIGLATLTLLLTATVLALARALRGRDFRIGRLTVYDSGSGRIIAAALLGPMWILTVFHAAPVIGESVLETVQSLPAPVWDIAYDDRTRTLRLSGEYGPGVAADFERQLDAHPDVARVELEGPGGLLDEGIAIAEVIESRNLATIVTERCASACTFAFAGGRERTVTGDGALGFHSSRNPSVLREWLADHSDEIHFLTSHQVDADFVARIYDVPSYDIWYPTPVELVTARVVTSVLSPLQFAPRTE